MDDAARAERVLAGAWAPRFQEEFRGLTYEGLLDTALVTALKAASTAFALRGAAAGTSDSLVQALERARKYKDRCREIAGKYARKLEEAKARENEMGGRLVEAELERDTWQRRCQEAEAKSAVDLSQLEAAIEALEEARADNEELARKLQDASDRADSAASDTLLAVKIAENAEVRAAEATRRADEAEDRAAEAEERARDAAMRIAEDAKTQAAEALRRASEAEDRTVEAEERAKAAEARAASAEAKNEAEYIIKSYVSSAEFGAEMAEASVDAYLKGFAACKEKVAETYQLEGLDALEPSDSEEEVDEVPEEASETRGGAADDVEAPRSGER